MKKNIITFVLCIMMFGIPAYGMEDGKPEEGPYGFLQNLAAAGASMPQEIQEDPVPVTDGLQYANIPRSDPAVQGDSPCGGYTPGTEPAGRHLSHSSSEPSVRNGERHSLDSILDLIGPERPGNMWHELYRLGGITEILEVFHELRIANETFDDRDDPNQLNSDGMLPLVFAITQLQSSDMVRNLLNHGANPNPNVSVSPLHLAVHARLPKIVDVLLKYGANNRATDQNERTPVDLVRASHGSSFISPEKQQAREQILALLERAETKARKAERQQRGSVALPTLRRSGGAAGKK